MRYGLQAVWPRHKLRGGSSWGWGWGGGVGGAGELKYVHPSHQQSAVLYMHM